MVGIGVIFTLIVGFAVVGVLSIEPTHYCETKQIKAYCTELSGSGVTCYTLPVKTGGKRCDEGWKAIPILPKTSETTINPDGRSNELICTKDGCRTR